MGIRQNIFISITIHAMVIVSALIVGGRIRDAAYRIPADYIMVSLFKELSEDRFFANENNSDKRHPEQSEGSKKRDSSPAFGRLRMTEDEEEIGSKSDDADGNRKRIVITRLVENILSEDNKEDNPPLPPFSKGGMGGLPEQNTTQKTGKSQIEDKILVSLEGGSRKRDASSPYAIIRAAIEKAKNYPFLARKKKVEGTVITGFTINSKGYPEDLRVEKSSGSEILDSAAIKIITRAAPFPTVNGKIVVPITFKLKELD